MTGSNTSFPWYLHAWAIVVALVVFWPVGLGLALLRVKKDRSFHRAAGQLLQVMGWLIFLFFGLLLIAAVTHIRDEVEVAAGIVTALVVGGFAVGGLLLLRKGSQIKKADERRRVLTDYIVNQRVSALDTIASRTGLAVQDVMHDVQSMVVGGFLPGYQLNRTMRSISRRQTSQFPPPLPIREFVCAACGAHNEVVPGDGDVVCEYCELRVPAS